MSTSDRYDHIYNIVRQIPRGSVTTYGHIAAALGLRSGARLVGWAMNAIPLHLRHEIPAHRVVNRNGELTGRMHFETPFVMRERLESEGVPFHGDRVALERCLWVPPSVAI